jgi:hypothetical protein
MRMRKLLTPAAMALLALGAPPAKAAAQHVVVEGELVDTWCAVSEIMFAYGTAHHQCALWCLAGGVPVSIKDKDGNFYMVLRIEEDDTSVAPPRIFKLQSHRATVEGDLLARNGVNYLLVTKIADDKGIVNLTHDDIVDGDRRGIVPLGE